MIQNEREIRHEYVLQAVRQMMTAARTAPKGKGIDIIEVAMVTDEDIKRLSEELVIMVRRNRFKILLRDADNILQAEAYHDCMYTPAGSGFELRALRVSDLCGEAENRPLCD